MKIKLTFIICIVQLLNVAVIFAQSSPTLPAAGVEITKAIPPSPDAASLGKYGSIPVSNYTGVPNISIPLYTIKSGQISLPVSLSYHAGGNKVEEMSSSVGLGWTLNAGGAIVRTIRGVPDEEIFGFLDPNHFVYNINATIAGGTNYTSAQLNEHLNQIAIGTVDGESDVYNFNFAGYSGKFVFDNFGNIMVIPQQNIKFTFDMPGGGNYIRAFTAKTPDGVTYVFGSNSDGNDAVEKTYNSNSCSPADEKKYYATSWFIKQITDALGHTVTFTYTAEHCDVNGSASQTKYQFQAWDFLSQNGSGPLATPADQNCNSGGGISTVKLNKINFENGGLTVYAQTTRADIPISISKLIDSIAIVGPGFSKSFHLLYTNVSTQRLRLDGITSTSGVLASNPERYSFVYNPDNHWSLESRYNQDYWGFNNGQTSNTSLVPSANFYPPGSSTAVRLDGAERKSDEASMMGGMLTSITYPTGGVTAFTYEANRESNVPFSNLNSNLQVANVARISNNPSSPNYNVITNGNIKRGFYTVYSLSNTTQVNLTSSGFSTAGLNDPNNSIVGSFVRVDTLGVSQEAYIFDNTTKTVFVPNGYYIITIGDNKHQGYTSTNTGGVQYDAALGWNNDSPSQAGNYIVGGLRIKQIVDYDGVSATPVNIRTYKYTLAGQTISSGWLDFLPVYSYQLGINQGGVLAGGTSTTTFFVRTATSNYPLATTGGSVVGYSHVEEDFMSVTGQNGKTEYDYTNSQLTPDNNFGTGFPFAPPMSLDWRRGLLTNQVSYRQNAGGQFFKVQEKINTYYYDHAAFNNELKAGMNPKPANFDETAPYYTGLPTDGKIVVLPFTDYTDFTRLSSTTTRVYSATDPTRYTETTESYDYDPANLQINKISTVNSKNETIIQTVTYPNNYTVNSIAPTLALAAITNLQNAGITALPIEEVTKKQNADGSNARVVKAVFTTYKNTAPLRDSVYVIQSVAPILNSSFIPVTTNSINFTKDNHYQPVVSFDKYDAAGNVLQERKVKDALHSYIWGYSVGTGTLAKNTVPIAEVINSDVGNAAYTNFESYPTGGTGVGNWTYNNTYTTADNTAPMGAGCYQLGTGTVAASSLSTAKTYLLSFWSKQGASVLINGSALTPLYTGNAKNNWTCRQYQLTGVSAITVSGSGLIDELRLYPSDALMSTYTYAPLAGMTAMCDAKNQVTTYSYDNIGRLTTVKNQDGNIVKKMAYNYTNAPINAQNLTPYSLPAPPVCNGEGNKLVNNICTAGNQVITSSAVRGAYYLCTYHYEWTDGTRSADYKQMSITSCQYAN